MRVAEVIDQLDKNSIEFVSTSRFGGAMNGYYSSIYNMMGDSKTYC